MRTYLAPEEHCYPNGGMKRKFVAYLSAYLPGEGKFSGRYVDTDYMVSGLCGLPDTFFSIPARTRIKGKSVSGYLTFSEYGPDYESRLYFCVRK